MHISIALCTYNGSRFLRAQLDSIIRQSRLPDELVICDDVSVDNTMNIVTSFADSSPFPVIVHRNTVNVGSTYNFDNAITLCSGDIISLADQDDVWLPNKLAQIEQTFATNADVGLVYSDALIVDAHLKSLGFCMSEQLHVTKAVHDDLRSSRAFQRQMRFNYVTGATMAFRSSFRSLISPISQYWVHDQWIATLIATQATIFPIKEPLIMYRQHGANQIGLHHKESILKRASRSLAIPPEAYERAYEKLLALQQRLEEQEITLHPEDEHFLSEKIAHSYARVTLPPNGLARIHSIVKEIVNWRYQRYAPNGVLSAFRDMLA